MGKKKIKMAKIGYLGFSNDYSHIGDRRRFAHYAESRGIELQAQISPNLDILVVTPLRDLRKIANSVGKRTKLILDLVDGYLHEKPGIIKDFGRGIIRNSSKELRGFSRYSKTLTEFILQADTVVVGTIEQASLVKSINPKANTPVILDYHQEIPELKSNTMHSKNRDLNKVFFWEGQSSNLKHLIGQIDKVLSGKGAERLIILTNPEFNLLANRFFKVESEEYLYAQIEKDFQEKIQLREWSPKALLASSIEANVSIIPINLKDDFACAKPENKLLIMWRLNLPAFVSPTPAYARVLDELNLSHYLVRGEWSRIPALQEIKSMWNQDSRIVKNYLLEYHSPTAISRRWEQAVFGN